jgi:hypothetical protein
MEKNKPARRNEPPLQIWLMGNGEYGRSRNELEVAAEGSFLWLTPFCFVKTIGENLTQWHRTLRGDERRRAARLMRETELVETLDGQEAHDRYFHEASVIVPLDRRCVAIHCARGDKLDIRVSMPYEHFVRVVNDRLACRNVLLTHHADRYGGDRMLRDRWEDAILVLEGKKPKYPLMSGYPEFEEPEA